MRRQRPLLRYVILLIVLVLAACAVLIAYRSPLAPSITGARPPATSTSTATAMANATPIPTTTDAAPRPLATLTSARPTATPAGLCGLTAPITLLFTGTGVAEGKTTADAIRVIRVDPNAQTAAVLAFPRDLYLRTSVLQSANMPEGRLGPAYFYKKQITPGTERQQTVAATTVLAQVLYDNFGVTPDHFITVNLQPWGQMIDTVGGIEVTLPEPLTLANGESLPAGVNRLDGRLAVEFVRYTNGGGEQARLARQDLLARAFHARFLQDDVLINAGELFQQFNEAVITDLSAQQIAALACLAREIPEDQVIFARIDETMVREGPDGALIPDVEAVRALVERTLNP